MTSLDFLSLFLESLYLTLFMNLELKIYILSGILILIIIIKKIFLRSLVILA